MQEKSELTPKNYSTGFLIDEELMAGVSAHPEEQGQFVAFVLRHSTGEYLGYQTYPQLEAALTAINRIPRNWAFEKTGGCSGGECATGGCATGGCSKKSSSLCPQGAPELV